MSRLGLKLRGKLAAGGGGGAVSPTITTREEFLNFLARASAGQVGYVAPGLDVGQINVAGSARNIGSNPIKLLPVSPTAAKWKMTGTGNQHTANFAGWKGLWLEGFEAYHDELGATGTAADGKGHNILNFYGGSQYITLRDFWVHGSATRDPNVVGGMSFRDCSDVLMDRGKISRAAGGAYFANGSRWTIRDSFITDCREDQLRVDLNGGNVSEILIQRCLLGPPRPQAGDHFDMLQIFFGSSGSLNGLIVEDCCLYYYGPDANRGQGLFIDNEGGGQPDLPPSAGSNVAIRRNIVMGCSAGGIFLNRIGGGANVVEDNECYTQQGGNTCGLYFSDATASYARNKGTVALAGSNTLTDGGGNTASGVLDQAGMQAKIAAWRAVAANVPA